MRIGVDLGGTTARVAAFRELEHDPLETITFPVSDSFALDIERLTAVCRSLIRNHSVDNDCSGIGLAIAGKVNAQRTNIIGAGNLTHWVGQPVTERLSRELSAGVVLGNDAEAAALAEAYYGHGQEGSFWLVIWGTGVGGCLVRYINGTPFAFPGEPGHAALAAYATECTCGQYGCLEAYVGGAAIQRRFGVSPAKLPEPYWARVTDWMSQGIHNLVLTQPADRVIFSGGVATKQAHRLSVLEANLRESVKVAEPPEVLLSYFGETAGTIGALALLRL